MSRQPSSSAPWTTMSGNFDFPPASSPPLSSSSNSATDPTAGFRRLQHLTSVLRHERERDRSARDAAAAERQAVSPLRPRLMTRRGRGRRARSGRPNESSPSRRLSMLPTPSPPPPPRPRATPGERFQSLRRQRQQREQSRSTLDDLEEASERLAQASSDLTTLLQPNNVYVRDSPGGLTPSEPDGGSRQRRKRRKLGHHSDSPHFQGFQYGHFGQVVPGRLKMELVSCDGGDFEEDNLALYRADNILKNDKSVYCTKSNHCNILLKHQGDTAFCLEKLVVKAPERGFTAPVQEGMVFVSMAKEDLIRRTSGYQIHYSSPTPHHSFQSTNSRDRERLTLLESLQDPEVMAAARSRDDYIYFGADEFRFPNADHDPDTDEQRLARLIRTRRRFEQMYLNRDDHSQQNDSANVSNDNCDWPLTDNENGTRDVTAPTPPPITITTETDNGSSDEELPSAAIMADRERRDSRWRPDSDSEDEFHFPRQIEPVGHGEGRRYSSIGFIRSIQRSTQSRIDAQGMVSEHEEPVLEPHARFFIEKNRSKVTIKFDPPISGKYMLLKLWSPSQDTNIDIQSVITFGFAGPRYFPSCEVR